MKQVFASPKGIQVKETPELDVSRGQVKIKVMYSCISAGTEMANIKGASRGLIERVKGSSEPIKLALDIVKEQGIKGLRDKIDFSMEQLSSSGYSVAGRVVEVGSGVTEFKPGDLVSAGGAGIALHAEYVVVPKNLVVHAPEGINMAYASIGTVGSISMHGVRRAGLTLGEYGVVVGCGLMGLLAIQMIKASGAKVACTDVNPSRLALAKELGADKVVNSAEEDPVTAIRNWTGGYGADAVLFTAATHSDEPLSQSFKMCRKKGKVVLLGVSGMNINRGDIYKDEIDFLISTSYGPGRYDPSYENGGNDYPYAYVRWTENRNIRNFIELINDGKINVDKLAPKIYPVSEADKAFAGIQFDPGNHIVTIIDYTALDTDTKPIEKVVVGTSKPLGKDVITIGLIGAGSFANNTLLPIIASHPEKFYLKAIVNRTGEKALNTAKHYHAEVVSSNNDDIFNDPSIDLVMICTRHNSHADLVLKGLKAGKHVYVEKPLATTMEQLNEIKAFYADETLKVKPCLMVGFNRRFSPAAAEIRKHLDKRTAPVFIRYRMNAGFMAADVWVHGDGGRLIGEGCHIIDLMQYLVNKEVTACYESHFQPKAGMYLSEDNRFITMEFADGSVAQVEYFSCGSKELPKEWLEAHWENKSIILDDYKQLQGYGIKVKACKSEKSAKGHKEEWLALYDALKEGKSPIPVESLLKTTELSLLSATE